MIHLCFVTAGLSCPAGVGYILVCDTQVFDDMDEIENINDAYWQLRAEAIPEDQLEVAEQDQLLYVYHCAPDQQAQVCTQQGSLAWLLRFLVFAAVYE